MEQVEIEKIHAQISEMMARTEKISKETTYYHFVVGASVTLAIVAVVKIFLS
jgi:hypothetical protein